MRVYGPIIWRERKGLRAELGTIKHSSTISDIPWTFQSLQVSEGVQ